MSEKPVTVCYPMAGDSLGGSHHSLLGLLQGLDPTEFEPIIVLEKPQGRLAAHFAGFVQAADPAPPNNSFAVGRDFSVGNFLTTLKGLPQRIGFLKQSGVRIVHTNDGRSHATWALAAKLAGCKLLWHHRADPNAKGLRYLAPLVADRIVTVSRFSLPPAEPENAQVVFSPFDIDIEADRNAMRSALAHELSLPDDTIICGYFGSYIDRKRPVAFIDTVAHLKHLTNRPVAGVMFGEASYPEIEIEMHNRVKQPDVAGSVHLMGYRSPGTDWIAAVDILLVPAVDEPLGRTLVEAMLLGTPVVATRSGGNPEAILEGLGKIVPPEDPEALAWACREVIENPAATAAMTQRARESARERFSTQNHVTAIEAIYRQLAGPDQ